ncbi:hypothetical protein BGW80DRAFT_1303234, partial [Lactifluus volemus]
MQNFVKNNEVMKKCHGITTSLRQACNHPSLVTKDYNVDVKLLNLDRDRPRKTIT